MEIVLPADIELKYKKFKTTLAPEIIADGNRKRYVLINTKEKEIIPESRMPSILDSDTFPQLYLWTLNGWDVISKWYTGLFREQMKSDTVLLLTMLKIAGIKGMPALVPANGEYFDESVPSLNVFNHVIAVVPFKNKYFWLDATSETAAYNSVPFLLPTEVFLMNEDGSYRFIKTPELDKKNDYYNIESTYNINEEGNAAIDCSYKYFGKAAEAVRYYFKYSAPEQRKKYFEKQGIELRNLIWAV